MTVGGMKTGAVYAVEPSVLTEVSGMLQETIKEMSLAAQRIPSEISLAPYQKQYEWPQKDYQTGISYDLDIVAGPGGATEDVKPKEEQIPATFFNKKLDYDEYRRQNISVYSLNQRLQDHLGQMALRMDVITYRGDPLSKYSIDDLMTATPGTEFSTPLDVSTTALAATTIEAAIKQLKQSLKYSGLISPQSTVIMEVTPTLWEEMAVVSTNEDFNARTVINRALQDNFSSASRVVDNWLLDATINVDKTSKVHSFTYGTSSKALLYVQDPRIMKNIMSPLEIRQSPVNPVEGFIIQPVQRHKRIDVEPLGVLVETAATVS